MYCDIVFVALVQGHENRCINEILFFLPFVGRFSSNDLWF